MSILFDDASTEFLRVTAAPVTAVPLTIAGWVYIDDITKYNNVMSITDISTPDNWFQLIFNTGPAAQAGTRATGSGEASATANVSGAVNTWTHGAAVFASAASRFAYTNGTGKIQNTTSLTPSDIDTLAIGYTADSSPGNYMSGRIAEVGVWNIALSDAEVAQLAAGARPDTVQAGNLVGYWPLCNISTLDDYAGSNDMVAYNTPITADHPPGVSSPCSGGSSGIAGERGVGRGISRGINRGISMFEKVGSLWLPKKRPVLVPVGISL